MDEEQNEQIDDILKEIREAIVANERKKYFQSFYAKDSENKQDEEIFELSRSMLVKREDIPYQSGMWNFDDVAKKILKKYRQYFKNRETILSKKKTL